MPKAARKKMAAKYRFICGPATVQAVERPSANAGMRRFRGAAAGGFGGGKYAGPAAMLPRWRAEREADGMPGKIDQRIAELRLELPQASTPAANYVPYVRTGSLVV